MPKQIKANQIQVRLLNQSDLSALNHLYADDQLLAQAGIVIDANPEFRQMVFNNWVKQKFLWGIFSHQLLIGTINLFPTEGQEEIGYLLMPKYQHHGIMTMAVGEVLQQNNSCPIFAKVRVNNEPSQRVLQKNGFNLTATDQGWMRFLKKN